MKEELRFLGLLNKGGRLRIGEDCLLSRKGVLLLLASDASGNSRKRYLAYAHSHNLETIEDYDKAMLGEPLGYPALSAILLEDRRASKAFLAKRQGKP